MSYIVEVVLNLICSVICYLTNWFVCLFANEVGELPGVLKYWQTWDDSLDVDFYVKEKAWKIFRYDFDSKYISSRETTPELAEVGRDKGCVILKQGATFSFKEKVQRYFCRVGWLTRNNAYGFAFYIFGKTVKGSDIVIVKETHDNHGDYIVAYDKSKPIITRPWIFYLDYMFTKHIGISIFLGWKIDYHNVTTDERKKAMIANRISIQLR